MFWSDCPSWLYGPGGGGVGVVFWTGAPSWLRAVPSSVFCGNSSAPHSSRPDVQLRLVPSSVVFHVSERVRGLSYSDQVPGNESAASHSDELPRRKKLLQRGSGLRDANPGECDPVMMAREKVPMFYFELDTSEDPSPRLERVCMLASSWPASHTL